MVSRKARSVFGLVVMLSLAAVGRSAASTIPLDNSWIVMDDFMTLGANDYFTGTGTGAANTAGDPAGTWSWTSTDSVLFRITDYFVATDRYNVYDQGVFYASVAGGTNWQNIVGCDNNPLSSLCGWTNSPDAAFLNPIFAKASFLFAPGFHSISIKATSLPTYPDRRLFEDSTVAISAAAAPVPEPTSMVLLGTGLLGVVSRVRSRRRSSDNA